MPADGIYAEEAGRLTLPNRHCEERSDAAIQSHPPNSTERGPGLLRFARNDG
jgi:hypothetical protein